MGTKLLQRLLSAADLRARVIASNLANQSTPGYTRRVVEFEAKLRSAMDNPRGGIDDVEPEIVLDRDSPARPDGNNVTLELELNALRENRLLYETYASMLGGHFQLLDAAVREGR